MKKNVCTEQPHIRVHNLLTRCVMDILELAYLCYTPSKLTTCLNISHPHWRARSSYTKYTLEKCERTKFRARAFFSVSLFRGIKNNCTFTGCICYYRIDSTNTHTNKKKYRKINQNNQTGKEEHIRKQKNR